jgi:hypothetical protein
MPSTRLSSAEKPTIEGLVAERRTYDGKWVGFWNDGTIVVGHPVVNKTIARNVPKALWFIIADDVSLYDEAELKGLVKAARKAYDLHKREPHRVRSEDLLRLMRSYAPPTHAAASETTRLSSGDVSSSDRPTTTPDESGPRIVAAGTYEAVLRRCLSDLGSNDPDILLRMSGDFWKRCRDAGVDPKVAATTIYTAERHHHEVARVVIKEASETSSASESPTMLGEEWEVIVRRHGASMNKIVEAAGKKADAVEGPNVIFGDFRDDEKAAAFARKMTKAGFVSYYGPHKQISAEAKETSTSPFQRPDALTHARGYYKQYLQVEKEDPGGLHSSELRGYLLAQLLRQDGSIPTWDEAVALIDGGAELSDAEIAAIAAAVVASGGSTDKNVEKLGGRSFSHYGAPRRLTDHELARVQQCIHAADEATEADDKKPDWAQRRFLKLIKEVRTNGGRARIADLRDRLPLLSKSEFDQTLVRMQREGFIVLYPIDNPQEMKQRDIDSAVSIAGDPRMLIYIEPAWESFVVNEAEEMPRGEGGVQSQIAARMQPVEVTPDKSACVTCIPWIKVSRDPAQHAAIAELAKKFGKIRTPRDVYAIVGDDLNRETQEVFLVIALNVHSRLMCAPYEIARGQRDRVAVGIDNVMDAASDARCAAFLVCHQHPGDSPEPSEADWKLYKDIVKATPPGRVCIDSLVVGPASIYSCAEKKLHKIAASRR